MKKCLCDSPLSYEEAVKYGFGYNHDNRLARASFWYCDSCIEKNEVPVYYRFGEDGYIYPVFYELVAKIEYTKE